MAMKNIRNMITRSCLSTAFSLVASLVIFGQAPAMAVTAVPAPLSPAAALSTATSTEINRRLAEITSDQASVKQSSVLSADVKTKLISNLDKEQKDLNDKKQLLGGTSDLDKVKSVATAVDSSFTHYQSTNQAAKLTSDLQLQTQLNGNLTNVANSVQGTIDNARAGGATHVNGGVAGWIGLNQVQNDLDQLKQNLQGTSSINNSVSSMLAIPVNSGLSAPSTIFSTAFGQLSVSQNTLSNTGTGLSQLSNLVTGNRVGISVCGIKSNCNGQTNNGIIAACGIESDCSNSTNNGGIATCGVKSDCSGSTNNGAIANCGVKSDCSNSTNNGLFANCGVKSDCSGSTNNGAIANCGVQSDCSNSTNNGGISTCGYQSNCSGSTNNGLVMVCGVQSNCSNSTSSGLLFVCGDHSDCSGNHTTAAIFICGSNSNCSTTIVNEDCDTPKNSDGQPITS
jgi:hypothetical protein